jgi:hypothetical protein
VARARIALVTGALIVWVGACAAAVVNPELVTLAAIVTPVMTAAVGAAFADAYLQKRKESDDPDR